MRKRDKLREELIDAREILIHLYQASEAGNLDEMIEVCGYIPDHLAKRGICARCGELFVTHNSDGSCIRD